MISVECGWDELCHVLLGDRFLLYYIQKKRENLQLFLETAAEDCVYLETVTPKTLTVLPEELSLPHALRDPYRAECLGWSTCRGKLPTCNSIELSLAMLK